MTASTARPTRDQPGRTPRRAGPLPHPRGPARLYAPRIHGRVTLVDVPIDHDGRVLLIERHVESLAELEGIVAAYVEHSTAAGMPALLASRRLLDTLADQLDAHDRAAPSPARPRP
jgi:hypothetical protein